MVMCVRVCAYTVYVCVSSLYIQYTRVCMSVIYADARSYVHMRVFVHVQYIYIYMCVCVCVCVCVMYA